MSNPLRLLVACLIVGAALLTAPALAAGQARSEVAINDTEVRPENLTSSRDGTVYFGSMTKGTIYRALPGTAMAEPWILASTAGLTNVFGVLADDSRNTLWVCQNSTGRGAASAGQTALRSFDLKTGAPKGTYPFATNGGVCNDMAVATDGTVYATESFGSRIWRLKPGATAMDSWLTDPQFSAIDGIALLDDGAVYVNTFSSGRVFRIPVNADGAPGTITPIETAVPLSRPDGLRAVGPRTLIQAEQSGRLTELTITGNRAEVRVIRDNLPSAAGVTVIGGDALVLVSFTKAVVVPYQPR